MAVAHEMLYTSMQAMHITGATRNNIEYWVTTGLVTPEFLGRKSHGHQWSFRNLVELQVLVELRKRSRLGYMQWRRIAMLVTESPSLSTTVIVHKGKAQLVSNETSLSIPEYAVVVSVAMIESNLRATLGLTG